MMKYNLSVSVSDSENLRLTVTRTGTHKFDPYTLSVQTYAGIVSATARTYDEAMYELMGKLNRMYD